jgi:hypothetical protein
MIININPYDTGFDENSSVMKFAALAREVSIVAPTKQAPPTGRANALTGDLQPARPHHRKVVLSTSLRGQRKMSETQLDVVEGGRCSFVYEVSITDQARRGRGRRRRRRRGAFEWAGRGVVRRNRASSITGSSP